MPPTFDLARIGTGLPFAEALPALSAALTADRSAVVEAPPGTGKTTLVPPSVADPAGADGLVVVTQPRRVAARAASRRLASLTGTRVGELAGHTVRGDRAVGPATRVEFVTPGVLVRRLLADPDLPGVAAVVLDEVHERHLESDLALAMVAELRQLRDDLLVVAMSATLDAGRFAALLGDVPVVTSPAVEHPLEVRYAPSPASRLDARGVTPGFLEHVAEVTVRELAATEGDALVFLPGVREIERVVGLVRDLVGTEVDVLPLHGGLGAAEQDAVVSGGGPRRRVVVSTDVAESSLTVPGVRLVVDACLSREPRVDVGRDMTGLVTVSASRDSCVQRAGRAARLGPGTAVRLVSEEEFSRLAPHRTPPIATSDLAGFALDVACWGAPRGEGLALPDAPPTAAMDRAQAVLSELGAIDLAGRVTDRGRALARVPADPRHARALIDGAAHVGRRLAAEIVALLAADRRSPSGDLVADLRALRSGRAPDAAGWRREARRLAALVGEGPGEGRGAGPGGGRGAWRGTGPDGDDDEAGLPLDAAVGVVIALAYPDRIARRSGEQYSFVSGTGAVLPPGSALHGHEWLAVAEAGRAEGRAAGTAGAIIRAAAPIALESVESVVGLRRHDDVSARLERDGSVRARRIRRLGSLELSSTPERPDREAAALAVRAALVTSPFPPVRDDDTLRLHRRMTLAHRVLGAPWPDVSGEALADRLDEWLAPEIDALTRGGRLRGRDLGPALRRLLPWPEAARFDELVPDRLRVPSGSSYAVDYLSPGTEESPILAAKLQECFGWTSSPTICDGRVPVTVHLLSPAGRPLAVTRDLAFFWREAYPGVRAEMRGRYPKHPWPEDPMAAEATGRTNRRR